MSDDLIAAIDDAVEHLHFEFDADEYRGVSTCGFAHIAGLDGRKSFVRGVKRLAESDNPHVERTRHGFDIDVGGVQLSLRNYSDGYRLSISNPGDLLSGPEYQRLDFRERIHSLILERLRYNGYLEDAYVSSRMD